MQLREVYWQFTPGCEVEQTATTARLENFLSSVDDALFAEGVRRVEREQE